MSPKSQFDRQKIPPDILIPLARALLQRAGRTVDKWLERELQELRAACGPEYAGVPTDDIRAQCGNLRRAGDLGSVKGHGPGPRKPVSAELQTYYASPEWKRKRQEALEYYGDRCMICGRRNGEVELTVHHNNYEALYAGDGSTAIVVANYGTEAMLDLIAICNGQWHHHCDMHRKRSTTRCKKNGQGTMF